MTSKFGVLALLVALCQGTVVTGEPARADHVSDALIQRIAFGSCVHQDKPQPIWHAVLDASPDLFVFLGDNVYGDTRDMDELQSAYDRLGANAGFRRLRDTVAVIATWDDHDYGENDAGAEYPAKQASRRIMLDFWGEPSGSARRQRDGVYASYLYGPAGRRVQIILLDLRWFRGPLNAVTALEYQLVKRPDNLGPYEPHASPDAQLLGDAQWQWLAEQLDVAADLRIIGSSIQLLAEFTGWESWANFPAERRRLIELLSHNPAPTLIISGDTHWSELSRIDNNGSPLWEITSSGLTEEWKAVSPNRHRVGAPYADANFGLIDIDWSAPQPALRAAIHGVDGRRVMAADVGPRRAR